MRHFHCVPPPFARRNPGRVRASRARVNAGAREAAISSAPERMTETQTASAVPPARGRRSWQRLLAYAGMTVAVVVVGGWIGAAFIPRWWSQRVGDQVNGSIPTGITLGLVYGFLFTVLPLLVLVWAVRKRRGWKTWLVFAGVAIVLAMPNLFTLGIVLGRGNAAHAGDRTLDVEAPGFRGGTLAGAILAALFLVGVGYLVGSRHRTRRELERLRSHEREAPEHAPPGA